MLNIVMKNIKNIPIVGALTVMSGKLLELAGTSVNTDKSPDASLAILAFAALLGVVWYIVNVTITDLCELIGYIKQKGIEQAKLAIEFANYKKNVELGRDRNEIEQGKLDALEALYKK